VKQARLNFKQAAKLFLSRKAAQGEAERSRFATLWPRRGRAVRGKGAEKENRGFIGGGDGAES